LLPLACVLFWIPVFTGQFQYIEGRLKPQSLCRQSGSITPTLHFMREVLTKETFIMNRSKFTGAVILLILTALFLVFLVPAGYVIVLITLIVNGVVLIAVYRRSTDLF